MRTRLLSDRDLQFSLFEVLHVQQLLTRPRYRHHSEETFQEILDAAKALAEKQFADHYVAADSEIPVFENGSVRQLNNTRAAWEAFADAGFLAAKYDTEDGGIQLPEPVFRAAMSYFCAANVSTTGYLLLTAAAIELLWTFGTTAQKTLYMRPMMDGRYAGTMAMTEPGQGSSLADITTRAESAPDGTYRLYGRKIFISGGDQAFTKNIVHLVLARVSGAARGTKGLSLFICPKYLLEKDGSPGEPNDIRLMGLIPKMGYHNTTSTLLAFGDNGGAVGYLIGEEHQGLHYMFLMMHEARIAVGTGAAALAYQGFNYSLAYARERRQGRLPSNKDPASQQVKIIQHPDVRRMLLAQKAYAEGGLALCLLGASLQEDSVTATSVTAREQAQTLLSLLTPIVKSWPSKYGVCSNDLAIQVLGGAGYTRDHPVEQYYRDQRLNPIHEGVEAIHALDLLGRRVRAHGRRSLALLSARVRADAEIAGKITLVASLAKTLLCALRQLEETTEIVSGVIDRDVDLGLASATLYLDVFGHIVVGWIWLQQAVCASVRLEDLTLPEHERNFYLGKVQTARYFIEWELPKISPQIHLLRTTNAVCFQMQDGWF